MARRKRGNDPFQSGAASRGAKSNRAERRSTAEEVAPTSEETAPVEQELATAKPVIDAAPIAEATTIDEPIAPPVSEPTVESAPEANADERITPEDAPSMPSPATSASSRPKLRLLRFDRPLAHAAASVEKLAEDPAGYLAGKLSSAEARRFASELWSRLGLVAASAKVPEVSEVDEFGRDAAFEARALELLRPIYRRYFRVEARGLENVPAQGPVILVANHSGPLPWDSTMLKAALAFDHPSRRTLRPLVEDFLFHFPFLGVLLNRFGVVRACQENAQALLAKGEAIAVFPEGLKGLGKTFRRRYRLQRFGRGGFVKLALRTGAPIVPVAIVGAEEAQPLVWKLEKPFAPLGLPFLPVTPTFPLLGPLGLLPLPTRWHLEFGAPMQLSKDAAQDELAIEKLTEDVRGDIQARLDKLLRARRGIFR